MTETIKKKRGFASMSVQDRKRLASLGGKAAQARGTGHRFTTEEASAAGKIGGKAAHANGKAHKYNSTTGSAAGKKAGLARRQQALSGIE